MMRKIILGSLDGSIPVRLFERNSQSIESCKTEFFVDFSSNYSKRLKMFQVL